MVVTNTAGLLAALKSAHPGDVILLAPGNYGTVKIDGMNFSGQVTIASQNESKPASIEFLDVRNSSGITFSEIDVTPRVGVVGSQVMNSKNITFDTVDFHSTSLDLAKAGSGLSVKDSSNITVTKSDFHELIGAVSHINANGLTLSENKVHNMRSDGFTGTGSDNVLITKNTFTDFHPTGGVHPDAIQMWTATDASSKNITITNNTITRGTGDIIQGIFITNEGGTGYENVKISGNAVIGTMFHGITITDAKGLTIEKNLIVGYSDMVSRLTIKNSTNVVESHNQATAYVVSGNTDLVATSNTTIKQPAVGDLSMLSSWLKDPMGALGPVAPTAPAPPAAPTPSTPPPISTKPTAGADSLAGTAGADTLSGLGGDDKYVVNHAGDKIVEAAGGGTDTVHTTLATYTLGSNVENLTLTGKAAQTGKGNALDNVLVGNSVNSTLSGGSGNDTLVSKGNGDFLDGGLGKDVFNFDHLPTKAASIRDFGVGMDQLDLSDLLLKYKGVNPVADGWVKFETVFGENFHTKVWVDSDGPSGAGKMVEVADLLGVKVKLTMGTDWVF